MSRSVFSEKMSQPESIYIIAEMSANHLQDFDKAMRRRSRSQLSCRLDWQISAISSEQLPRVDKRAMTTLFS
jgi:hypothetical protein